MLFDLIGAGIIDAITSKIELDKEKAKQANANNKNESSFSNQICAYIKNNCESYIVIVENLIKDTKELVDRVKNAEGAKLKFKERIQISNVKADAQENLKYLYLSKEFLSLADKNSQGVPLSNAQSTFVEGFSSFFDGRKVLREASTDSNGGNDLCLVLEKMLDNYMDEIFELKIPNFDIVFKNLRLGNGESADLKKTESVTEKEEVVSAPKIPVEAKGPKFCTQCGNKLNLDARFCSKCGAPIKK